VELNTDNELAVLRSSEAAAKLAIVQRDRWRELGETQLVSKAEVEERATQAATSIAQVEAQRALIAQKTIRAPFDGVLGIRKVNLGQFISPGTPIVGLQQLDPIFLDFTLPEQQLPLITTGATLQAVVDSLPGEQLQQLAAAGVRVAIDDFGSGYSNFGYLSKLPVSIIKIDKSLIDGVATHPHAVLKIKAIVQLAAGLGYRTVAEGVETEAQADVLTGLGCDELQGYFLARPMGGDEIERSVRDAAG